MYEDGIERDYISARKNIYVPHYYEMVKDRHSFTEWRRWVLESYPCATGIVSGAEHLSEPSQEECVVVYDFDGPRKSDGSPTCELLTLELLREKINDTRFPFGHGYVVAAGIAGIVPAEYCR